MRCFRCVRCHDESVQVCLGAVSARCAHGRRHLGCQVLHLFEQKRRRLWRPVQCRRQSHMRRWRLRQGDQPRQRSGTYISVRLCAIGVLSMHSGDINSRSELTCWRGAFFPNPFSFPISSTSPSHISIALPFSLTSYSYYGVWAHSRLGPPITNAACSVHVCQHYLSADDTYGTG